jgi:hypothetical protein
LLCGSDAAQKRSLVDEARRRDTNPMERNEIRSPAGGMLALLGDRDSATQLFQKLADEIKGPRRLSTGAEPHQGGSARIGFRDLAAEHCAR